MVQGPNLGFIIYPAYEPAMGWVHLQADNAHHLVDQQGMVGQLEGLAAMGTESERPPDAADGGLTQSGSGCQGTTAPVGGSFRGFFQSEAYGAFHLVVANLAGCSRAHLIP